MQVLRNCWFGNSIVHWMLSGISSQFAAGNWSSTPTNINFLETYSEFPLGIFWVILQLLTPIVILADLLKIPTKVLPRKHTKVYFRALAEIRSKIFPGRSTWIPRPILRFIPPHLLLGIAPNILHGIWEEIYLILFEHFSIVVDLAFFLKFFQKFLQHFIQELFLQFLLTMYRAIYQIKASRTFPGKFI